MKLKNGNAQEFLKQLNGKKIICFGAGSTLIEADYEVLTIDGLEKHIAFFVDNDSSKWGLEFHYRDFKFPIQSAEILDEVEVDKYVLLITCASYVEVYQQLTAKKKLNNISCFFYNCICSYPNLEIENFFEYEIKKPFYANYQEILQSLELKDKYKGKRCFIIGNGPSLTIKDLEMLNNEITFASNRIFTIFNKTQWRPTYYFCIDYLMYGLDHEIIKDIEAKKKFVPTERAIASGKVYQEMTYYNRIVNCTKIKNNEVVRNKEFNFSLEIEECVYGGQSVTYDMLQFAVYMGFSEIYLLGMDHCYPLEVKEDGTIVKRSNIGTHFSEEYDEEFDKNIAVVSPIYAVTAAYEEANKTAANLGVTIRNATRGGELEVFERVNFDDLFPKKPKAILFGAGGGGKRLVTDVLIKYQILFFVDNDERKWGNQIDNYEVCNPKSILNNKEFDVIIITSAPGMYTIKAQLQRMGITEWKIITDYVELPLRVRNRYIQDLATLEQWSNQGAVAEAGVFQGEFAKVLNEVFKTRRLYLFDTFEGFDQRDIVLEKANNFSEALQNDYAFSSVELVMDKMMYPNNCIVKKGYFPETAEDIDEQFCFVNLDLDLYLPTLEGLKWFSKRMVTGGIILIHDYFTENFKGVRKAVTEFLVMEQSASYTVQPIGDGISVAITGFKIERT